jgi:ribose 5-phosphate isomerase B
MKIALGADHRGAAAARALHRHLAAKGHTVCDAAICTGDACDYPDNAFVVGMGVRDGKHDRGILICGTGIGVSIAANKIKGIRAALVHDEVTAAVSRRHNDANVLCLSGDLTSTEEIIRITDAWLETEFEDGRHARRVNKIAAIEQGQDPTKLRETSAAR